jgi:hypothetical protein
VTPSSAAARVKFPWRTQASTTLSDSRDGIRFDILHVKHSLK